jgi:hypothetical protein
MCISFFLLGVRVGDNQDAFKVLRSHPLIDQELLEVGITAYKSSKNKESWLSIAVPVLAAVYPVNPDTEDDEVIVEHNDIDLDSHKETPFGIDDVPDIAIDMHTKLGRSRGLQSGTPKGGRAWIKCGRKIENEYMPGDYKERKRFYEASKTLASNDKTRFLDLYVTEPLIVDIDDIAMPVIKLGVRMDKPQGGPAKKKHRKSDDLPAFEFTSVRRAETDLFKHQLLAHVPTGDTKQDVFFGTLKGKTKKFNKDDRVVCKGPYPADTPAFSAIKTLYDARKKLGLPYIEFEVLGDMFVAHPFPGQVYDGSQASHRNRSAGMIGTFVIFKSLLDEPEERHYYSMEYGDSKSHKSDAWKASKAIVIHPSQTKRLKWKSDFNTFEIRLNYVLAIYFRSLFGVLDHASRNFVVVGDEVYGVDEENVSFGTDIKLGQHKSKSKFIIENWDDDFTEDVNRTLKSWSDTLGAHPCRPALDALIENPQHLFE